MTNEELQDVVAAVIQALKTNSKTISQLTPVTTLADADNLEVSGGKRIAFEKLKELVAPDIADDLNTDDATKALSARQGHVVGTRLGTAEAAISDLGTRLTTAEGEITSQGTRLGTAEDDIEALETRADTVEGEIFEEKTHTLSPTETASMYIKNTGELISFNSTVYAYAVASGDVLRIKHKGGAGVSKVWAAYSADSIEECGVDTLVDISVGTINTAGIEVTEDVVIPAGASLLVACKGSSSGSTLSVSGVQTTSRIDNAMKYGETQMCVKNTDNGLLIASLVGDVEHTFWFKRCMFNNLFTFYHVGVRNKQGDAADTDGIEADVDVTILNNAASSDNIGPVDVTVDGTTLISGGNHSHRENGVTKTARTDSVSVSVDGIPLKRGTKVYGRVVDIEVVNTLFDPSPASDTSVAILTTPMVKEVVRYRVSGNSIMADVEHTWLMAGNNVSYHGFQSMFMFEKKLLMPKGQYPTWVNKDDLASTWYFTREDYPDFRCYVERDANDWCQCNYLRPTYKGDRSLIGNKLVFTRSGSKDYHQIIRYFNIAQGDVVRWQGVYAWFKLVHDTSDYTAWKCDVDGREAWMIAMKGAAEVTIDALPSQHDAVDYKDDNVSINGHTITSTADGLAVLLY